MNPQKTSSQYSNSVVLQTIGLVLLCLFLKNSFGNIEGTSHTELGSILPIAEIVTGLALLLVSAVTARKQTVVSKTSKGLMVVNAVIATILVGGTGALFVFALVFAAAMGAGAITSADLFGGALQSIVIFGAFVAVIMTAQVNHWRKLEK